jgi:formylglycine-generating enzyme required for sulfatase activity
MYAPAVTTGAPPQTTAESAFDVMDGTISSSALGEEEQAKLAASREAYDHEQKQKDSFAREQLARDADGRRRAEEEAERKRKEQEERVLKEQQERADRERQQREQIERVERQARELEERLSRLATSMPPPQSTMIDPESTQVHRGVAGEPVAHDSFRGAANTIRDGVSSPLVVTIPPQSKSNSKLLIGAVILIVLLVGGGTIAYFMMRSNTTAGPGNATPTPVASPEAPIKPELVEIPGGTFQMGRNDGPLQETPAHPISVQSFFMDKTEVTNAEYADFVRETHHAPPSDWNGTKPPYGTEMWPVLNISLDDVNAFAEWRSKRDSVTYRLPTEQEWEYAARNGDRGDLYPWGKQWKDNQAVLKEATPEKVGSHPEGNNRWGVSDLLGNVWEWTSSKVSAYPGNPTPIPTATRDWLVIRGAGYDRNPQDKDNPVTSCIRTFVSPNSRIPQLGFRLVRSA